MQQPLPPIPDARVLNGGSSRRNTRGERLWHDVCRVVRAPPLATPVGLFSWPRESPSVSHVSFFLIPSFSSVGCGVQQPPPPSVLREATSDGDVE